MKHILLLEDEPDLAEQIQHFLQKRGYQITWVTHIAEVTQQLQSQQFSLLLLDRLVKDGDSLAAIEAFRAYHSAPIVMLTALGQTVNRIEGYQQGVEHYFAKPVDLDELLIVLQNLINKSFIKQQPKQQGWTIKQKLLHCPNGQTIPLSGREILLLEVLMQHENQILDKTSLLNAFDIVDDDYDFRRLDSMLYRMRKKVAQVYEGYFPLETLHNLGYAWKTREAIH